jgi:hypothetical protein
MKPAHKLLFENNLHESHWGLRIINAEDIGKFTWMDTRDASKWVTCACGKIDVHIERRPYGNYAMGGSPKDSLLLDWGNDFSDYVDEDVAWLELDEYAEFFIAAEILVKIQARSIELFKESLNETSS